jgi:xylulose-5-phosphate/fructose-6-phosphate phosphoketolase
VIDRVPRLQATSGAARERLKNKLIEHKIYVRTHGEDMPEVQDWAWSAAPGPEDKTPAPSRNAPEG